MQARIHSKFSGPLPEHIERAAALLWAPGGPWTGAARRRRVLAELGIHRRTLLRWRRRPDMQAAEQRHFIAWRDNLRALRLWGMDLFTSLPDDWLTTGRWGAAGIVKQADNNRRRGSAR